MFSSIGSPRVSASLARSQPSVIRLALCLIAAAAANARVDAQVDGPVAAYSFTDTSTIAADVSGHGNDAVLLNLPMPVAGRFGSGLQLDGVDDVLQLPLADSLNFSNAFTFEAWIAPSEFGHERSLWWTPGAMVTLRPEGTVVPVALLTDGQVGFVSERTLSAGVWSHVAVTYDGRLLRLYIDGVDAGSRVATGTLLPSALEPGVVGGASGFAGKLDEVRFYRRALGPDEIRLDEATPLDPTLPLEITAHSPQPNAVGVTQTSIAVTFSRAIDARTITTATLALLDSQSLPAAAAVTYDAATRTATIVPATALASLAAYTVRVLGGALGVHDAQGAPLTADASWSFRTAASSAAPSAFYDFSEAAGTTAADRSGNGNDAALMHGATWAPGRIGGGLRLDGVDDAAHLPLTQSLALSSAFTMEAFVAPAALDRDRSIWWTRSAMLTLRADGTLVPVAILTGGQVGFISEWTLPADAWSHVAVTYDGSLLRLYINGMEAGSRPATGTLLPSSPPEAGRLGGASAFVGTIDEVRLYRRALSAAEIAADMAVPSEPATPPPASPAPQINAVDIVSSWLGQAMLVTGGNFGQRQATSTVTINGTPAAVVFWSKDTILAVLPRGVAAGPVVVKVEDKTSNVGTARRSTPPAGDNRRARSRLSRPSARPEAPSMRVWTRHDVPRRRRF